MQKIVICDIDSTLTDHWKRIRRNTQPSWPGGQINPRAWTRQEVMKDKLLSNCLDVLNYLDAHDFYIRYLSARAWVHARQITKDQLKQFGLPNPQDIILCSNLAEKVSILSKDICNFYIDDFTTGQEKAIGTFHKDVALTIQEKGIHVIVFRNDWLDVLEQIERYEEQK